MENGLWKEGKYIGLWSVAHLLAGLILGLFLRILGISTRRAFVMTLSLLILWEFFELAININEIWTNRVADILIGLSGFFITYYGCKTIRKSHNVLVFLILLVILVVLNILGWRSY